MKVVIVRYEEDGNGYVVDEIVEDLIQCKDCKFYDAGYEIGCALNHKRTSLNDYCSEAERREE